MNDLHYLKLLAKDFPNEQVCGAEIINLRAILALPKGTEYFFSDLHGEYEAFHFLLRSASGEIRAKIDEIFGSLVSEEEQLFLANLICYPDEILRKRKKEGSFTREFQILTLNRLVSIAKELGLKYTRSKVRKKMPVNYAYAIDELLHTDVNDSNKKDYHKEILNAIVDIDQGEDFIIALCNLIQVLAIDQLHILGDIFDRGPHPDKIMDELMSFKDVDIEWGNHDIEWLGASLGNKALICSVVRIATSYNSFDVLEDGYGINLRPFSMFASEIYKDDPCTLFYPHILDQNVSDYVNPQLVAKMNKAITILMLKEEGKTILRHPEYHLEDRLLLNYIDYEKKTVTIGGKVYPLKSTLFPTIDPNDPYKETPEEENILASLVYSFTHSQKLHEHMAFLMQRGSMYRVYNGNLLYHGCIPMDKDGNFLSLDTDEGKVSGKKLMDYFDKKICGAYFTRDTKDIDLLWYLWVGPLSPLFGKAKMATFESCFLDDKDVKKEIMNPYYSLVEKEETIDKILEEFSLSPKTGHVINGHVPVKVKAGESPLKANGKYYVIDGGLSKAYHSKTGIAGYTLISSSHYIALAEHKGFVKGEENTPLIRITERAPVRIRVKDTDKGVELRSQIEDLTDLLHAYQSGLLPQKY